jgi:drug/metabolite transporter (DMT)-like permease
MTAGGWALARRPAPARAVALMVVVTALWALTFVAPLLLRDASPVAITLGRLFFYGLVSGALLVTRYRRRLGAALWARAALYGFVSNILFSVLVSFGVQDTGAEVVVPITGLIPLCVSILGSRSLPRATWRRLVVPFVLLAAGLAMVLLVQSGALEHGSTLSLPGIVAALATVVTWTWYALSNARFLRRHPSVGGAHWSCVVGTATFAVGAVMAGVAALAGHGAGAGFPMSVPFLAVSLALGVGTSWLAAVLFNQASNALPMGLVGQLIVLETLFGIAYTCLLDRSLPPPLQAAGIGLVVLAIWMSARVLNQEGMQ